MTAEYNRGRWFELIFGLATGAFFGALGTVYLVSEKDLRVAKQENTSIETKILTTKNNNAKTRELLIDNAETYIISGNPDYAGKNIDHFLSLNPTDEERLKALRVLNRIATYYREHNRPDRCAEIYQKVSYMAPDRVKEIMDPENVVIPKTSLPAQENQ